jgi:hypothetical protein
MEDRPYGEEYPVVFQIRMISAIRSLYRMELWFSKTLFLIEVSPGYEHAPQSPSFSADATLA